MKCLKKVNVASRVKSLVKDMNNHWGLNQDKALAIESHIRAILANHKEIGEALLRQGYITQDLVG
jgi:hypothetical protein